MTGWMLPLVVNNRHLTALLPGGGAAIVDTGSPVTLWRPNKKLAEVEAETGIIVTGLLGNDQLGEGTLRLNCCRGLIELTAPRKEPPLTAWPLGGNGRALPTIDFKHMGQTQTALLDTGAQFNYAPAWLLSGRPVVARVWDFFPGFGAYELVLSQLSVEVMGEERALLFGSLPLGLGRLAEPFGDWILGADLFVGRDTVLDLRGRWISQKK